MPARRSRLNIRSRLADLEERVVLCRACAAASQRYFRVLPDEELEEVARTGVWRDVCPACGAERRQPVKLYAQSDWELLFGLQPEGGGGK